MLFLSLSISLSLILILYVRTRQGNLLQARKRILTRKWTARNFDLGLPSLQNLRNKFLIKSPSLWYFFTAAWVDEAGTYYYYAPFAREESEAQKN